MNDARAPAQCRAIHGPRAFPMLPDPESLARKIAAAIGGAPDAALAARLIALCRAQLEAARPALDRVGPADAPDRHAPTLRELADDE